MCRGGIVQCSAASNAWIFENKLAWRRLQWPDFLANEVKLNKDILVWIRRWICGYLDILSQAFFASRIGHPELECIALSFLLEGKLGVKGNRLKRNGSGK